MRGFHVAAAFGLLSTGVWLLPGEAPACGGFFCDQGPSNVTVITQNAERIVFSKRGDTVKAYIQIRYEGEPVDFAWIVPVVSRPTLDVADADLFDAFENATAPQFRFPPPSSPSSGGGGGFGCGGGSAELSASPGVMSADGDGDADRDSDGVEVWGQDNVGPYATAVITADETEDLTRWLGDNDYTVPEEAYGIISQYVEEGSFFVAIRLQSDATSDLIQPLVIEYEGDEPCVPLRLTKVAAQPDLGVLIWIVADEQAYPYNYARAFVDDRQVVQNPDGTTNYLELLSAAVDAAGHGRAFVTEYAQPTSQVPDLSRGFGYYYYSGGSEEAEEIVRSGSYLTRLYTQIDPQEMTIDPIFELDADLADVSNVHDLTQPGASAGIAPPRSSRYAFAATAGLPLAVALGMLLWSRRRG